MVTQIRKGEGKRERLETSLSPHLFSLLNAVCGIRVGVGRSDGLTRSSCNGEDMDGHVL